MLTTLIILPLAAALFLLAAPVRNARLARAVAAGTMSLETLLATVCLNGALAAGGGLAFETRRAWLPDLGIGWHLGVGRLGGLLVFLTALVGFSAALVARPTERARFHHALGLVIVGGMVGAFVAQDLFFFYVFHEFALIPTFLLIWIWGGARRREAAMKITLYLLAGSLVLLVGLLALVLASGAGTFDLPELRAHLAAHPISNDLQALIFLLLLIGFGTLVSLVPLHTWAPIGYAEAPPLAAMLHAGAGKKFGLYGLAVVAFPLLPSGAAVWKGTLAWLAAAQILYAGYIAMRQDDLRRMLAWASVSHMGFGFLALAAGTPTAMEGFALFLFAHGVAAAAGFALAGFCRDALGVCSLARMGGLAQRAPFAAAAFTMVALAGFGVPGFANFPAELMIFAGGLGPWPAPTILALWGTVIGAVYFLRAVQRGFLGPLAPALAQAADLDRGRRVAVGLLLAASLAAGFLPRGFLGRDASISTLASGLGGVRSAAPAVVMQGGPEARLVSAGRPNVQDPVSR
ncbi:MAG: NADH-quinone oxidoreductase subunit M [Verrucomicrobiae bacterium]|nr:NADH-quinone oxidoreductase subunit M [Verrucomicrobiae bacterium]